MIIPTVTAIGYHKYVDYSISLGNTSIKKLKAKYLNSTGWITLFEIKEFDWVEN
jgi:hypothetical protein